jgi:hypothetical protein
VSLFRSESETAESQTIEQEPRYNASHTVHYSASCYHAPYLYTFTHSYTSTLMLCSYPLSLPTPPSLPPFPPYPSLPDTS